jgi:hypothetical protein
LILQKGLPVGRPFSLVLYGLPGNKAPEGDQPKISTERGKGDHMHVLGVESRYQFVSVEKLVADFLADVERVKNEHHE